MTLSNGTLIYSPHAGRTSADLSLSLLKKKNLLSWSTRSTALCMTRAGPTTRPEHQHG
jgi:hypothetical protein